MHELPGMQVSDLPIWKRGIMGKLFNTFKKEIERVISENSFETERVSVSARPLTPEEAIGNPHHDDYPLLKGKERIMEAVFQDIKGHAYSDHTGNFSGTIQQVMNSPMDSNFHRALFVSTANAILRKTGIIKKSCHCKDDDPIKCAEYLIDRLMAFSPKRIGMIGNQPRLLGEISKKFDVRITDRDPDNIGATRSGIIIEDSEGYNDIINWADLLLVTGTTIINGTIDHFLGSIPVIFYGITVSGVAEILNLNHFCPLGR